MLYLDNIKAQMQKKFSNLSHKHIIASTAIVGAAVGASLFITDQTSKPGEQGFFIQSVEDVDGRCGSAHKNTLFSPVTLATPGLCAAGQESRLIIQDKIKPYSVKWDCVGGPGMATEGCEANLIVMNLPKEEKIEKTPVVDKVRQAWTNLFKGGVAK